jgi:hypothetical protein
MMNLTIKMSLLIINLYMINAYKICPRNSYYKVVDFSANYDIKTSQYWICKKCSPGYVSNGIDSRCDYCPWFSECDIKSTQSIVMKDIIHLITKGVFHVILQIMSI